MFLVVDAHKIDSVNLIQRLKFKMKNFELNQTAYSQYTLVDVNYTENINYEKLSNILHSIDANIILSDNLESTCIKSYELSDFLLKININTVIALVCASRVPINKREITFIDENAKHIGLARLLVDNFFVITIITNQIEEYTSFKNDMMEQLGAIVLIKNKPDAKSKILISSDIGSMGNLKIGIHNYSCFDIDSIDIAIPHNVNKLKFIGALYEINNQKQYNDKICNIFVDRQWNTKISFENLCEKVMKQLS